MITKMNIKNIKELNTQLEKLFTDKSFYKNVEWTEIENGARIKITMEFWRGPFNETPIKFEYLSSYTKEIDYNNLVMKILGSLADGAFFFRIDKERRLRISKNLECY